MNDKPILVEHQGHIYEVVPYVQQDVFNASMAYNARGRNNPVYDARDRERIRQVKAFVNHGVNYLKLYQETVGTLVDKEV